MTDLFETQPIAPLAERLRPEKLTDVVGQTHLLGSGQPLALAVQARKLPSLIFWGPPGVGKTTLARILVSTLGYAWIALSAVFAGVKDIRAAMEQATQYLQAGKKTILFIDEIHRFNKAQQDALLPYVEKGLVTFIGATTENPSFEVNAALLSRAQVYVLTPLSTEELTQLFERAQRLVFPQITFTAEALAHLIDQADGDARRFLNGLEQCLTAAEITSLQKIDSDFVQKISTVKQRRFDKNGEAFYDQISALHKSVRGSHPDAALYWLCRMLDGGADPHYLARRMIRMAWEDIGLADPRALQIVNAAAETYARLGSPEGELALAEAVLYLAVAPKSNAAYVAYQKARAFVQQDESRAVPLHLRNAPTKLMADLGYGKAYRYAHDEPNAYAAGEQYLPEGMAEPNWYQPVPRGLEIKIGEKLDLLKQTDLNHHKSKTL